MKQLFKAITALLVLAVLVACEPRDMSSAANAVGAPANTFRILAGSELKDIEPMVTAFGKSQGISVKFEYSGSLDAVDRLSEPNSYDAAWLSHGKYLQLMPSVKSQIKASEKTMFSRVVLGIKPEKMKALGWKSGKTTWHDVISAAKAGKFHFAMTNPAGSNTGFIALVGVASELSGKGDALEPSDIPTDKLKELFIGQSLTSGSSGALADQFIAAPEKADGMVNYESVIRTTVQRGLPLEVLIPKEGVITADYPLMLLSQSKQQAFYEKLVEYLRSEPVQQQIASQTFRTPLKGDGSDAVVNELPFPASVKVVDALLSGYQDVYSRPSSSYFVLDTSGSMNGQRIMDEQKAMETLAQGDGSVSGRFATFRQRENIAMISFSDRISPIYQVALTNDANQNKQALNGFSQRVRELQADGGTAIYSAILSVYDKAQAELKKGDRTVSIVLLTDGENNQGARFGDFIQAIQMKGAPVVPVHTILYGEANTREMNELATATGGRVFDARAQSLKQVMKTIRAYQ